MANSEQPMTCFISTRCTDIDKKTKNPVHIMVFGVVINDGDVVSSHLLIWLQIKHGSLHQMPGSRGWLLKYPTSGNRPLRLATQDRKPNLDNPKISAIKSPQMFPHQPSQMAFLFILRRWAWLSEISKMLFERYQTTLCNSKDQLKIK